jgi:8-oxo-dGTP diphosphatase
MIKRLFYSPALWLAQIYWRIAKPKTYGVKVVVSDRSTDSRILLVRHSYGRSDYWHLPGGGYKPASESPLSAVAREVREELRVNETSFVELGVYKTEAQYKQDTVTLFGCTLDPSAVSPGPEIAEVAWAEKALIGERFKVYSITKAALAMSATAALQAETRSTTSK